MVAKGLTTMARMQHAARRLTEMLLCGRVQRARRGRRASPLPCTFAQILAAGGVCLKCAVRHISRVLLVLRASRVLSDTPTCKAAPDLCALHSSHVLVWAVRHAPCCRWRRFGGGHGLRRPLLWEGDEGILVWVPAVGKLLAWTGICMFVPATAVARPMRSLASALESWSCAWPGKGRWSPGSR